MHDASLLEQSERVSLKEQDKLDVLAGGFIMLDDSQKDYIRELTRKLADIHCGGEFGD
jgi:hypothetical protein